MRLKNSARVRGSDWKTYIHELACGGEMERERMGGRGGGGEERRGRGEGGRGEEVREDVPRVQSW